MANKILKIGNWWKHAFEKGIYPLGSLSASKEWSRQTPRQIEFIKRVLDLPKRSKILDIGCGTGRHSLLLAKAGYDVTGVDISKKYLTQARQEAQRSKIHLNLIHNDMRRLNFRNAFDAAINLFTSFGYFPSPSDDLKVIRNIAQALKPNGKLLIDIVNGPRITRIMKLAQKNGLPTNRWSRLDNLYVLEEPEFLEKKKAVQTRWTFLSNGTKNEMVSFTRMFASKDLSNLCAKAGLKVIRVFGDLHGSRYNPINSPRLVILAQKS